MLARRSLNLEKALRTVEINHIVSDCKGNQVIETNIINMADSRLHFKIIAEGNFNMEFQEHKVFTSLKNLKEVTFTNNWYNWYQIQ